MTNLGNNSLTITKHLFAGQEYKNENVVFSPLSLQVVLSIITAGSEGPTQQQLLDFLRFKSTDDLNSFISHILSVIFKEATPFPRPHNPSFNAAPTNPFHRPPNPFFNAAPATPAGLSYNNEHAAPATPFHLPHNPFFNAAPSNPFHRPPNPFFNAAPATPAGLSYNNGVFSDRPSFENIAFFGQGGSPPTPAGLSFTNGVWIEQTLSLQPSFKEIISSQYKATLSSADFINNAIEVIKEVNLWAEKETNGRIKEILPQGSVDQNTSLIFANALHFKGAWKVPFINHEWRNIYDFHLLNGRSVKVPFMTSDRDQFIGAFDGFKVLRLPYEHGQDNRQFSMYIFLPNAKKGLRALVEKVSSEFDLLEQNLPLIPRRSVGDFRIPKFKFSFGLETSRALMELGVILPFHPGGLTKMVDSSEGRNLFVSKIFHKCFIEVNEKGTEAAAATAATIEKSAMIERCTPGGIDFVADHPFLFLIRQDLTQTILFVGQVLNPLAR